MIDKLLMRFEREGQLLFTATQKGKLAYLDGTTVRNSGHSALVSSSSPSLLPLSLNLWHRRLSHINMSDLKRLLSSQLVTGLHLDDSSTPDPICEPCIAGKQHRMINKTASRSSLPLEVIHCDLHGPMPVASPEGHRYWILFVDDATRLWSLFFIRSKDQAAEAFWAFRAEMEKQTGYQVKCLHDDKEGGLSSNAFNAKLRDLGIVRRFTMRAEPHSNGVAERAMRTISESASALLFESHLPSSFWSRAVSTVVYLHN